MTDAQFRALNATTDMFRLRQLHDECFPIQYDNEFYDWVAQSSKCLCVVAVLPPTTVLPPPVPSEEQRIPPPLEQ